MTEALLSTQHDQLKNEVQHLKRWYRNATSSVTDDVGEPLGTPDIHTDTQRALWAILESAQIIQQKLAKIIQLSGQFCELEDEVSLIVTRSKKLLGQEETPVGVQTA